MKAFPHHSDEFTNNTLLRENMESRYPTPESLILSTEDIFAFPMNKMGESPKLTAPPYTNTRHIQPSKKKPSSSKQGNTARKHQKLRTTTAAAQPSLPTSRASLSRDHLHTWGDNNDMMATVHKEKPTMPEQTSWGSRKGSREVTSHSLFQISPFTMQPTIPQTFFHGPKATEPLVAAFPEGEAQIPVKSSEDETKRGPFSKESRDTTTPTIITPTVITTEQTPSKTSYFCNDVIVTEMLGLHTRGPQGGKVVLAKVIPGAACAPWGLPLVTKFLCLPIL